MLLNFKYIKQSLKIYSNISSKIWSSLTIFNNDNNQKCFLISKSSLHQWVQFLKVFVYFRPSSDLHFVPEGKWCLAYTTLFALTCAYIFWETQTKCKQKWYQVRTGHWEHRNISRWPGAWFGPLPCIYIYMYIIEFFYCFAFPMCQSDHVQLWNSLINQQKKIINRFVFSGSITSVPCLRQTVLNRVDTQDSRTERKRKEETVKCSEITNLFSASSAGQFHL